MALPTTKPVYKTRRYLSHNACPICGEVVTWVRHWWAEGTSVTDPPASVQFRPCGCIATDDDSE